MHELFKGKKVLITGGTGSIGEMAARQILKQGPSVLRIFDIDETRQFELQEDLAEYKGKTRFLLGNVCDKERLQRAMEDIDIVLHMAALKHVYSGEYNPFEAVKTNVFGTQNVIDAATQSEVEKVVFTSSDKAVNPFNVMGTTKLLGERLVTAANYYKGSRKTRFSSVRFGNVLGSRGSIVPLFAKQISKGGPVTITDKAMTRFVLSSKQAVQLLFKATELAQGGEVFVFKMDVLTPLDLAQAMVESLAPKLGKRPEGIKLEVIGQKPGEKMFEELMTEEESKRAFDTGDMFVVLPELKELFDETRNGPYSKMKKARQQTYSSANAKPLSRESIKEMLSKENLL